MKSSTYYFHVKTKILADFQNCISVPLNANLKKYAGRGTTLNTNHISDIYEKYLFIKYKELGRMYIL